MSMGLQKAVAWGDINPTICDKVEYNPSLRILVAMSMLTFPVAFFAIYQCFCTGEKRNVVMRTLFGNAADETDAETNHQTSEEKTKTHAPHPNKTVSHKKSTIPPPTSVKSGTEKDEGKRLSEAAAAGSTSV